MKNTLWAKGLAIAIAVAFLLMAINGLGNSKAANDDVSLERIGRTSIQPERLTLDMDKVGEMQARMQDVSGKETLKSGTPGETPNSVQFDESFEDDILGEVPDDPPWLVAEVATGDYPNWGPDEFEDDIVGSNPDAPWVSVDAETIPSYWWQDFESYAPPGTPIPPDAFLGDDGYFWTIDAGATLVSATPPAGAPSGSVQAGLSTGSICADFVDSGTGSYFGPAGPGDTTVTTAFAGGWFYLKANQRLDLILYDLVVNTVVVEIAFYPGYTELVHWPGGGGAVSSAGPWSTNTWHELFVEYDETSLTYSIWFDGTEYNAGSAFMGGTNIDGIIVFGDGTTSAYVDNIMHFVPSAGGGTHTIEVSNAYSSSLYGGTQSVYLDQNGYAGQQVSCSIEFPAPYAWGEYAGMSWSVMTSTTTANTNGATFRLLDYNGRTLMALRFSGGNIQYLTGATWTTIIAFAANTEYHFDLWMDSLNKVYGGLYIDETDFYDLWGEPLANRGAGVAGFRAEGTLSTQSEIYFDHVTMWGELQDGTVRVSDMYANTGTQSVRMWEGNAADYTEMGAYIGGELATYGEIWFHFYGDGTLGGGSVWILDSAQANTLTVISIGTDLTAANIPHPGEVQWVDGGYVVDGPVITPNTWNNISIRYDCNAGTYEARWNGVLQGTFDFAGAAPDGALIFFDGEGPAAPSDWFFDDIGHWVDDIPATPQNLRTYFPDPMPSTEAWYGLNQDNAVEGTVTGTYANLAAVDGTTQDIQEALIPGSSDTTTYDYQTYGAGNKQGYVKSVNNGNIVLTNFEMNAGGTWAELTGAQYGNIAVINDGSVWQYDNAQSKFWRYHFHINEAEGSVTGIDALWDAARFEAANAATLYIWDDTGSTWVQLATGTPAAGGALQLTGSATGTMANYVDSGGYVYLGIRVADPGAQARWVETDYVSLAITFATPDTHSLEHRWRTENVPAGADVMKLYVTGRTSGGDDTFSIGYSSVLAGPYAPLLTISSATMTTYDATLPTISGQFYINVIDSNSGPDSSQDTVHIDAVRIYWQEITGATTSTQIATADNPVEGSVTGTYTLTHPPADGSAQQFTEVDPSSMPSDPIEMSSIPGPTPLVDILPAESFEGAFPPAGWTIVSSGADRTWIQGTNGNPYTSEFGSNYAYVNYDSAFAQDEWLVTPSQDCSAYQNLQLTYCIEQGTAWDDYIYIRASTNGGSTWSGNLATHYQSGLTMTTADMQTLDLSAYDMTADLQIAFILWTAAPDAGDSVALDQVTLVGDQAGTTLEHVWTMQNLPDNALSRNVYATARFNTGSDDNFQFGWSQNVNGPFTPIAGLLVNSDTYNTYTGSIPVDFPGGPLYINVIDTIGGDSTYSTLYVDSLYVESVVAPVNTSVNVVWDLSADDGGGQNDVVQYNVYYSDSASGGTLDGAFNYLGSVPAGTGIYKHYGESEDLVDNIWYIVTAQDTYSEGFSTMRASKFNVAPEVQSLLLDGMLSVEVPVGTPVALACDIYDDSSTWEDVLKMDGGEWYVDADPGEGLGTPLNGDGLFDTPLEGFTSTIDTTGWTVGTHLVYVRGHEAGPGNTGTGWGVPVSAIINITGGPEPYDIDLAGHLAGDWVFVSFPIAINGNIEDVLNDATNGDGLTTWDVAKWFDGVTKAWVTYRPGYTSSFAVFNTMGVWLHLTANGGDGLLTTGMGGDYSAAPVVISLYEGWNMVGYPSETNRAASATLPAQADMISVWQAASPYISDTTDLGSVIMSHGNAYWVRVSVDCTWTVDP